MRSRRLDRFDADWSAWSSAHSARMDFQDRAQRSSCRSHSTGRSSAVVRDIGSFHPEPWPNATGEGPRSRCSCDPPSLESTGRVSGYGDTNTQSVSGGTGWTHEMMSARLSARAAPIPRGKRSGPRAQGRRGDRRATRPPAGGHGGAVERADADEVAEVTLGRGLAALGGARGLLLVPGAGGGMDVLRSRDAADALRVRPRGSPAMARCATRSTPARRVFPPHRASVAARYPGLDGLAGEALAALPLPSQGLPLGVLLVGYDAPRAFPSRSARSRPRSRSTAQALDRARLFVASGSLAPRPSRRSAGSRSSTRSRRTSRRD